MAEKMEADEAERYALLCRRPSSAPPGPVESNEDLPPAKKRKFSKEEGHQSRWPIPTGANTMQAYTQQPTTPVAPMDQLAGQMASSLQIAEGENSMAKRFKKWITGLPNTVHHPQWN